MPDLTAEQKKNIRTALRVAQRKGASPKEQKALVEAMGVESTYRDLNYGDRDSLGILQQRNNGAWGAAKESVATDVGQFLDVARAKNASGKYGDAGSLAQAVQGSAFGGRYGQRSGEADAILARYGGGSAPQARVRAPGAPAGTVTSTTPGTDNSALRRQLVGQFLQQGGIKNPSAVLGLAAQYGQAADVPGTTTTRKVRAPSTSTRASGGARVSPRAKAGDPVVSSKQSVGGTHETAGLAGYPAKDYFAPAGTHAVAPVSGTVVRLSGHNPADGPTNGPHGPLGYSVYIKGSDGKTYFLTHMGSRSVKAGQKVKQGQVIGTVADYDKYGTPSHIHQGVQG